MSCCSIIERAKRPLKFMGVGVFMTAVNAGVLVLLVDGFGMLPVAANLSRVAFTTQLHFLLHRKFTWKGNHVTTLWQQWYRYHLLKVLSVLMGQLGFMLFYLLAGLPCVLAFLASITLVGVLNLLLFDKLVFMLAKK